MRPKLAGPRSTSPRVQNRHRRLVAEQSRMFMHGRELQLIDALRHPGRLLHPPSQRLTIDVEAMTGKDLRLAIQRRTPGELRRRNPGDEGCRGHAALDQTWARLGLNHRALAGPARVFGTDEPKNPQDRGNLIEHLADILADAMERAGAARTRCRLRLDRHVAARKMLGQGPDIAVPLVPRSRKRARGLYLNHPLRRRRATLRFYRRGDAPLRTALIRNSDRNECRRIRRRLFARQIPGLLAPTMQQAAAHAMSTGDCGDVRAQRETLRHYPSALLVAPTPATACSANQLDTAVALVTLATVLMIVILHGEPRRDLSPPMLSQAPQIGRWRRRAANDQTDRGTIPWPHVEPTNRHIADRRVDVLGETSLDLIKSALSPRCPGLPKLGLVIQPLLGDFAKRL